MSRSLPSPPEVPPGLSPAEESGFLQIHGEAHNLRHRSVTAYLSGSLLGAIQKHVEPGAVGLYLDQLLDDAGTSKDPLEQMMIEQMVLAHHSLGSLHLKAAQAETPEEVGVYIASIARLFAEFRRALPAIKEYRSPSIVKNVTVVEQQNVANNQQVAMFTGDANLPSAKPPVSAEKHDALPKLSSNDEDLRFLNALGNPESEASSRWTTQLPTAERFVLSRPGSFTEVDPDSPAVATLNGAAHR